MPDVAGRVADAFAARTREGEERALSPLAVRSYETRGRERAEGIGDLHVTVDLSSPGEPKRLIAETIDRFGRVDCLVNNVGGTDIRELEVLVDEDWQTSFELNLMSAIRATQAATGFCAASSTRCRSAGKGRRSSS